MAPYSEMVYTGYARISDWGSIPKADGFDLRQKGFSFIMASFHLDPRLRKLVATKHLSQASRSLAELGRLPATKALSMYVMPT